MSLAEVGHRLGGALRRKFARALKQDRMSAEVPRGDTDGGRWIRVPAMDSAGYISEADAICGGSVRLFASRRYDVGAMPSWNRCPLTGIDGPIRPSRTISITDRAQVGDIKYVWELNRHLHWVTLAQAWALSKDAKYLDALRIQIASWLDQCACGIGPNWTSSLELSLRLINWSIVWQLVDGLQSPIFASKDGRLLQRRWLESINLHVRTVATGYSRYSSANNHLIGELAGVFVAGQTWPYWDSLQRLGDRARSELEREILCQTTPDGVCREQAFEYASFIFDFFLAVERSASCGGRPMTAAFSQRMAAMCGFAHAVSNCAGVSPQVGDADGAEAFRLDPRSGRDAIASMLQKGALLFSRSDWMPPANMRRDDIAWLFKSVDAGQPFSDSVPRQLDFTEGGYFIFGRDWGTPKELMGLIDAGPLGYLGIAAHGHADALQVWLSLGGVPVLIDPGTYSYWAEKRWRDYFRGTSAHNTVRIGGVDQSESGGRFMWINKAACQIHENRRDAVGGLTFSASHDGYSRLPSRFSHHRRVEFSGTDGKVLVVDKVSGHEAQLVELFWHVAPEWQVVQLGETIQLSFGDLRLDMKIAASVAGNVSVVRAQDEGEPLGWYSKEYGQKQACTTIRWAAHASSLEVCSHLSAAVN